MNRPDPLEWLSLRVALGAVALIAVADIVAWKAHDLLNPPLTRLESTVRCLENEKGVVVIVPAGDPLSSTAGEGSLRTTIEGNGVIVALASSEQEASEIERNYQSVGGDLAGRLERRYRTVYLWDGVAPASQRQAMYDCQY